MRKTLLMLALLCLCARALYAQQPAIEKSEEFDEPEYGWNKLLQLKNGNTFFFHSTRKDGIEVVVYDKQRKQIASETLESRLWDVSKMKYSKIVGLHEINGEPVLFVMQQDEHIPTLYRMRINGTKGTIVKEDKLGHLPKVTLGQGFAVAYGHLDMSDIIVEKDPASDCYAVIYFNTMAHNRNERIKVEHYDGTHKKLGEAFYTSPTSSFKYLRYIGSVVDGSKRIFVSTYGYNSKAGEQTSRIIVSRWNAGDTGFNHKILDFSDDFSDTRSVMRYNRNNNMIQLLTLSYMEDGHHAYSDQANSYYMTMWGYHMGSTVKKDENEYFSMISYIDPETLKLTGVKELAGAKVNEYGKANIDKEYEYGGIPQQMIINKDNTTTILSEEITSVAHTHYSHGMMAMAGPSNTTYKTRLGPIGVSVISDTGAELRGYAISKSQEADGRLPLLYINERSNGRFMYPMKISIGGGKGNSNEFLSFDYVNTDNANYIIFNDLPGNADKEEENEKRKMVRSASSTNTMCYKLNDPKLDKFYLFGEPDDKHNSTFCYIEASDYNKDINTYATLIVERDGRSKMAKIAWVKFQ